MSIRWKLGIIFLVISLVPLTIFAVIGIDRSRQMLKQEIGLNFELIAREKAMAVASALNRRVKEAVNLAKNPRIIAAVADAGSSYAGKDDGFAVREIKRIDRAWLQSKGDTPAARNVLGSDISAFLRGYVGRDPLEYGEIFITDRLGATVGMTSILTDYYQADEGWWSEGFASGKGAVYIDDRGLDLSVNAVVTGVVVPVRAGGEIAGLLKINFKMAHLPAIISNPFESGDVRVFMLRSNGTAVIDPSDGLHEVANETEARIMAKRMGNGWTVDEHGLEPTIMGYGIVQPEKNIYSRFQVKQSMKGVSGETWGKMDWYVFVERGRARAYEPLTNIMIVFIIGGAFITIAIVFMAGATATRVTSPLLQLRKRLETISTGNLDIKVSSDRKDEIGDVQRDIDRMVVRLKETMTSREELEQEVGQRKKAEEQLRQSARFGQIVEKTLNEIYLFDPQTLKFVNVNHGARTNLGYTMEELQDLTPINIKPEFTRETFEDAIRPLRDGKEDIIVFNTVHKRKDGTLYNVEVHLQLMSESPPPVFVAIIQDVTKRKQVEEALYKVKEEAEKANEAKSEFLASMSHELRTPLNAVLGFAQMLQFDPKSPLSPAQSGHVESILEGGNHLLELVNEVLDLARIEANQLSLSLEEVNANDVVADCVAMSIPLGEPRDITIIDQFSGGSLSLLRTDRLRLKQVLLNLLSNAFKFGKDGETVSVDGRETENRFLHLSVTDTGVGIAEEDFPKVFHMFHRLGVDPMIAQEGTGIGLTVTKLLVEQMAGRVGFESEEGVGSTFWIELPLASNKEVLIWADTMRIGVDSIDKDHQVIISLLNRVTHGSADDTDMDGVVEELIDYTRYHFSREEAVMEACGYPDLEKHRDLHQSLVARVKDLENTRRKDRSPERLGHLRNFLRDWLFGHIMNVDTEISQYTMGKEQEIRKALKHLE